MKKIPTLFVREFENHKPKSIRNELTDPSFEWVLKDEGLATEKFDGACCAVIDGIFYRRYDAKKGKNGEFKLPPEGAIPCDEPDEVTGHWPHWVKNEENDPAAKWFWEAKKNSEESGQQITDGTYEAIGPHFQGNPYGLEVDILVRHGDTIITCKRDFERMKEYLRTHHIEGIVFWKDNQPVCKIKRSDFGFPWP